MFGLVERALNRATAHIWFERSKASERAHVAQRYVYFCQPLYVHYILIAFALTYCPELNFQIKRACRRSR